MAVLKWAETLIMAASARTTPIMITDASAKIGMQRTSEPGHWILTDSTNIGTVNAEPENDNGEQLREMLQRQNLAIVNSFLANGANILWSCARRPRHNDAY